MILKLIQAIIAFIKQILSIFKENKQQKEKEKQEEFNKVKEDLKEEYNKIDISKENEKKNNLKDRLDNMF